MNRFVIPGGVCSSVTNWGSKGDGRGIAARRTAGKLAAMTPLLRPRPAAIALLAFGLFVSYPVLQAQAQVSANQTVSLPSGLSAVAELAVSGSQLALDSNGNLYRSDDSGKRWHPIKQQWQGKAVELLGMPGLAPGSNKETFVAVLLKSTASLHWVSLDKGKTWQPSTLDDVRRNDVHWSGQ
jgi:photosystem II stability/assembly factor-like uncharacterized protein